ncbi:MAG: Tol-Pal system beta propeller repeat protein TolB [Alphaproteobacteria bacterium]
MRRRRGEVVRWITHGPARRPLAVLAVLSALVLPITPATALVEIDITQGNIQPLPIAVPAFVGEGQQAQLAADLAGVVAADLARSGLFAPLDRSTFFQTRVGPGEIPRFADWRVINAQALVAGGVALQPDGRLRVDFRLWDVLAGKQITGQQLTTRPDNWRRVAHQVADLIYERLTGERGYFDTRIVFVDESGPKHQRVKRLAIMDQDGANMRFLTDGRSLVLTPRFNPVSQEVAYMSYAAETPRVHLLNIETGQQQLVDEFPGMTFSPRFSPDGQQVIMSLQQGADANIFTLDLRTGQTTRLTDTAAIDTGPSYAPDGRQIVFESDRGGSQQLYIMGSSGSNPHRITFSKGSYSTPVWSPRGDLIAFTRRHEGKFAIGVIRPDGSGERILTEGFHNEGPTWAPNGRVIMFFRDLPGANGGPQLWTVDLTGIQEFPLPLPSFASDPAWSPLLD